MKIPYNLKVSEEERIYKKMIDDSDLSHVHIAPHALKVAAIFTILTRLKDTTKSGVDLIKSFACMMEKVWKALTHRIWLN